MMVTLSMRLTPKQAGQLYQANEANKTRIKKLESAINQTIGFIEDTNSLRPEDNGESLRLLKSVINQK